MTIEMDHWDGIGLTSSEVLLADWSAQWPALFDEEASRIREACGESPVLIEHIGSTSVPGACSRPMIDIMIGIEHLRDSGCLIEPLKQIGYRCHGENGVPGRRHFTRSIDRRCLVNLQLFQLDSEHWSRSMTLRDRLRSDQELLGRYMELKKELQARFPDNPDEYQVGKAAFEEAIHADR
ncbi:MAG: GrpB family protein [Phycisphaerales bacterium]|nr:GrpB family protein [Phycisphaerales bacterium]